MPTATLRRRVAHPFLLAAVLAVVPAAGAQSAAADPRCAPSDAGITLPPGFCATIVADSVGAARHVAVAPNGDLFIALRNRRGAPGGILALRDTDRDGRAEVQRRFGENGGTGIALAPGFLYFATDNAVLRYRLDPGELVPAGAPDTIVTGLPADRGHPAKSIALGPNGALFVNIGSPSNSCQVRDRQDAAPGHDPCPELETRAGIWRFDANRVGQTQADGERYATGIRNAVGITVHPRTGQLYAMQHGRDQLHQNWASLYTAEESAELPSEELLRVDRGDDFGWPYCYHDPSKGEKVLAPEYGGDGDTIGRCASAEEPAAAFPAHWGPNAILFYTADQFPARYRGGAFIAFHGSWNRAPLEQQGFNVVFVPYENGRFGTYEVFADGFRGVTGADRGGRYRPSGLAVGPDGSLYVTDDQSGRIYRISYTGR